LNLSLRNRVASSFIIANLVVLVLGFTVFYFLDSFKMQINDITQKSNKVSVLTDEISISTQHIFKLERSILKKSILTGSPDAEIVEKLISRCENLTSQLQQLESYYQDVEVKKIIAKMLGYIESLQLILSKASLFDRDSSSLSSIVDLIDKIQGSFMEFQDIYHLQNEEREDQFKQIYKQTKKNMMYTLIITFIGTILLGLVVPGKIALPFKKIKDAIRELQDCNFDVSIFYNQDDEIGEIASEMNKMILSFKKFEELRTDRISLEKRKFDALANMSRMKILVANANGELIYMNNHLYSLLKLQSDDVILKNISDTLVPDSIKEAYEVAIKRRSKIENAEIKVPHKKVDGEEEEGGEAIENDFEGYANVIPVRGKDSSLDYYLMVISDTVFA